MSARRGVLVACLLTAWPAAEALQQQGAPPRGRVAAPAPCSGDSVDVRVRRDGFVPVPDVNGMTPGRAKLALAKVRLGIEVRGVRMDGPVGVVIAQSPQPGSTASTSDVVIVCTRLPRRVPSVVGLTFDEAQKNVRDSGFEVVKTNSFVSRESQVGIVVRQQPPAGAALSVGGVDTLVVGIASRLSAVPPPQAVVFARPTPGPVVRLSGDAQPVTFGEPTGRRTIVEWALIAGLLLGGVLALVLVRARRPLTSLRVTPHRHSGNPRVVVTRRDDEATR